MKNLDVKICLLLLTLLVGICNANSALNVGSIKTVGPQLITSADDCVHWQSATRGRFVNLYIHSDKTYELDETFWVPKTNEPSTSITTKGTWQIVNNLLILHVRRGTGRKYPYALDNTDFSVMYIGDFPYINNGRCEQ